MLSLCLETCSWDKMTWTAYNVNKKLFKRKWWLKLEFIVLPVLTVSAWVFSGCSSFFPLSRNMQLWWHMNVCLSLYIRSVIDLCRVFPSSHTVTAGIGSITPIWGKAIRIINDWNTISCFYRNINVNNVVHKHLILYTLLLALTIIIRNISNLLQYISKK